MQMPIHTRRVIIKLGLHSRCKRVAHFGKEDARASTACGHCSLVLAHRARPEALVGRYDMYPLPKPPAETACPTLKACPAWYFSW